MREIDDFKDIGFAKLDLRRAARTGTAEAVYCPGKTAEQLLNIFLEFRRAGVPALGTKCSAEQFDFLVDNGFTAEYDPVSKVVTAAGTESVAPASGLVAVCTGGTADIPVAEEAARTAEFFGVRVERHFDVGVAGIHRLFARLEDIRRADAVVAVAGMEGALAGVIAGLVEAPVVAVPTSVGYGASFEGIAPLLTMMNSCAEGVSVVNIDNGFGAGILACRMIRMAERRSK
ncbi:MAG: nickel pincer cofactor biosynthesis protein LarB [Victivallaceae bacterium]|nr:nickel pincer cofactor biosynthesis protein LarB [Victivallaceae bacterium]